MQMGIEAILAVQSHLVCLAETLGCDWTLLAGQLMRESSGDPRAIGDGGMTYGLCQIHLPTAYQHPDLQMTPPGELLEPGTNMQAYILEMIRLWNWLGRYGISDVRVLLACWNWGPGRMKKHLDGGGRFEDLPDVVREYVESCDRLGKGIRTADGQDGTD